MSHRLCSYRQNVAVGFQFSVRRFDGAADRLVLLLCNSLRMERLSVAERHIDACVWRGSGGSHTGVMWDL